MWAWKKRWQPKRHALGLAGFAERVLKTPYTATPLRGARRRIRMYGDNDEGDLDSQESTNDGGVTDLLQRLEDSVAHLRGELGIQPPESRYITLHGGVGALGDDLVQLYDEYKLLAQGLSASAAHIKDAKAEAATAKTEAAALAAELGQWRVAACTTATMDGLRRELREVKADRETLEDTVLAIVNAVDGIIGQMGQSAGARRGRQRPARLHPPGDERWRDHGGRRCLLGPGGGHGLGTDPPAPKHIPVHRGDELRHVPYLGGRGASGGHDEA